ncbi:MAG TPA: phosphoribosyltransferase family protein [Nitrososphaera sp.]|nr:phosphoribosyltransferase family protein [Nitrososphaera sp.]
MKFRDRQHAGRELAERLAGEGAGADAIILGIPRGGVILADIVATRLGADFDIVIPRKLGAPENDELAIGAVMQDGTSYLNKYLINALRISEQYLEEEKSHQISEIERRSAAYRKQDLPYRIAGRKAILVDDGIATGATVIASARWVRKQNPSQLTIAVPVAPTQSVEVLEEEADTVMAVHKSRDFSAVGQFYEKFEPVTDEQVQSIMQMRGLL